MKSSANYNPKLWGKCGWTFLHYVCLGYSNKPSEEIKTYYKNFLLGLGNVLPCEECRENFIKHSKKILIDDYLDNANKLFEWIIKIQNETNKILNKKLLNYENLKKYYVNENRILEMKACCGLLKRKEQLAKKLHL